MVAKVVSSMSVGLATSILYRSESFLKLMQFSQLSGIVGWWQCWGRRWGPRFLLLRSIFQWWHLRTFWLQNLAPQPFNDAFEIVLFRIRLLDRVVPVPRVGAFPMQSLPKMHHGGSGRRRRRRRREPAAETGSTGSIVVVPTSRIRFRGIGRSKHRNTTSRYNVRSCTHKP